MEILLKNGRKVLTDKIHISQVRAGDTIFHDGHDRMVCGSNITGGSGDFMGFGVFGDCYKLGYKPVTRIIKYLSW